MEEKSAENFVIENGIFDKKVRDPQILVLFCLHLLKWGKPAKRRVPQN